MNPSQARIAAGAVLLSLLIVASPRGQQASPAAHEHRSGAGVSDHSRRKGERSWLSGTVDERFATVARQLRGFDVAMMEVGYRYGELYWAGQDRNWDFAIYQIEKIRATIENAIQRRPARGQSAAVLEGALPAVEEAVRAKDPAGFATAFELLTLSCNACHRVERVPFVHVSPPSIRHSVVSTAPTVATSR